MAEFGIVGFFYTLNEDLYPVDQENGGALRIPVLAKKSICGKMD
jgi:hypothetical protein